MGVAAFASARAEFRGDVPVEKGRERKRKRARERASAEGEGDPRRRRRCSQLAGELEASALASSSSFAPPLLP